MTTDLESEGAPTERLPGRQPPDGERVTLSTPADAPGADLTAPSSPAAIDVSPRLAAGRRLAGRFVILRFIARGGMGEVYEALDSELGSPVAVKTILPALASNWGVVERFRREVLLARRVTHANVCRIFELYSTEVSTGDPLKFLTMEFLDGESLARRLKRVGRVSPREALSLLRQMVAALEAAHTQGIVHCDFKPSNVILVPLEPRPSDNLSDVRAVVTDFGIARALVLAPESEGTQTSARAGTPHYMAPEQVTGDEVGPATDIYALGLVLYEMLTGSLPFAGVTPLEAAVKRVNERPPPPRTVVPELDERWNAAVLKCLERDPGARFSTAGDVVRFLERPAPVVSRRKALTVAIVGVAVVLAALLVPALLRKPFGQPLSTPLFHARVPVAVGGFTSVGDLGEQAWVPSTLAELLRMELEAGETSLRVSRARRGEHLPESSVGMAKASLGLSDADLTAPEARQRLSALLGTQWLLTGTIRPTAMAVGQVEVQMSLHGSESSPATSPISETFAPDDLLAASSRLGERLRAALDVSLSSKEVDQLHAARPRFLAAARLYVEGLQRLTRTDYPGAQQAFAASTAADGSFHAAHVAEAGTWLKLGNGRRARDAAQRARETAAALSEREQQLAEALALLATGDERGSRGVHTRLFETWPDDRDLALELVQDASTPESGFAVLDRWRKSAENRTPHLFLQIAEAELKNQAGDKEGAKALLDSAEQRARAMGARIELGEALWWRANWLARSDLPKANETILAAEALFRAVPEPEAVARIKADRGVGLGFDAIGDVSLATEALSEYRRLGMQDRQVSALLEGLEMMAGAVGDVRGAEHRLSELEDQARSTEVPESSDYFALKGWLALLKGELRDARSALVEFRRRAQGEHALQGLGIEAVILREEDRLAEARALLAHDYELAISKGKASHDCAQVGCRVECDSKKYKEGLACLDEVSPYVLGDLWRVEVVLAREECRVAMGDAAGALSALTQASEVSKFPPYVARRDVLHARAEAQQGRRPAAITQLKRTLAEAEHRLWGVVALEARLALGEVELQAGRAQGRRRLAKLDEEARSRGFLRIARLAREALDSKAQRPPSH